MTDRSGQETAALLRRISAAIVGLMLVGTAAALPFGVAAAAGVAAGAVVGLAILHAQRVVAASVTRAAAGRRRRSLSAVLYLLRWPAIGVAFYFLLGAKLVSPIGLLVGITTLPVAITVVGVRGLPVGK